MPGFPPNLNGFSSTGDPGSKFPFFYKESRPETQKYDYARVDSADLTPPPTPANATAEALSILHCKMWYT
jgi:hypothetical protein